MNEMIIITHNKIIITQSSVLLLLHETRLELFFDKNLVGLACGNCGTTKHKLKNINVQ